MTIYEKRWDRVKELATQIIELRKEAEKEFGNDTIFMYQDERVTGELLIRESDISIIDEGCTYNLFENNPDWDNGSNSTMKEIKQIFDDIKIYVPYKKRTKNVPK